MGRIMGKQREEKGIAEHRRCNKDEIVEQERITARLAVGLLWREHEGEGCGYQKCKEIVGKEQRVAAMTPLE